jgi:hypothetical protein
MPTQINRYTAIYERIGAELQNSPNMSHKSPTSTSPQKTPSIVFEEFARVYEQASLTQTPPNTRDKLISLGKDIETSPEFALLSTKVQRTYLLTLDHLQHGNNPLRTLLTRCRILLRTLIYWASGLPENRRIHILEVLKKAADCLDSEDSMTEEEIRKLYAELRDAQEKISKLSKFPFQEIENLLEGLKITVNEIRDRSAYERLKQEYEAIKPINRKLIQEKLKAVPSLKDLQENFLLTSFDTMKPILKLHFTKEFLSRAQREKGFRPLAKKLFQRTLKAFNDRSEQEQAAVKEFVNESCSRIQG